MVHRNRKRYVVLHVLSPENTGKGLLIKLVRDRTRSLSTEEFNEVKPWFVFYHKGWAVIRTTNKGIEMLLSILKSLDGLELNNGKFHLRIIATSGTLRAAYYKHVPESVREDHHYREEWERR